jgi:hypothetical protein
VEFAGWASELIFSALWTFETDCEMIVIAIMIMITITIRIRITIRIAGRD